MHAVITSEDAVRAGYVQSVSFFTVAGKDGRRAQLPPRPVLAHERVLPREAFPYKTPTGSTYEIADFNALLRKALHAAAWNTYVQRESALRVAGAGGRRAGCLATAQHHASEYTVNTR